MFYDYMLKQYCNAPSAFLCNINRLNFVILQRLAVPSFNIFFFLITNFSKLALLYKKFSPRVVSPIYTKFCNTYKKGRQCLTINKYSYTVRFRPSSYLFNLNLRRLPGPTPVYPFTSNVPYSSFFRNYTSSFFTYWVFLVGNLISPYWSDLLTKRINIRPFVKIKVFRKTRRRRNAYTYETSVSFTNYNVNTAPLITKKLYYCNIFYFSKLRLSFSSLDFLAKISLPKIKKATQLWLLAKPYLFLNNRARLRSVSFNSSLPYSFHKLYAKLFFFTKKLNVKTRYWHDIWFKKQNPFPKLTVSKRPSLLAYFAFIRNNYKISKQKHLKFFINQNAALTSPLYVFQFKRLQLPTRFLNVKTKTVNDRLKLASVLYLFFKKKKIRHKVTSYLLLKITRCALNYFNKFNFPCRVRGTSSQKLAIIFKKILVSLKKKSNNLKYSRFYLKKAKKLLLWSSALRSLTKKRLTSTLVLTQSKRKIFNYCAHLDSVYIPISMAPLHPPLSLFSKKTYCLLNSAVYLFLKKTPLFHKYRTNFVCDFSAFLHLNNGIHLNYSFIKHRAICSWRKLFYSFATKNELERFVLRRYIRNRAVSQLYSNTYTHTHPVFSTYTSLSQLKKNYVDVLLYSLLKTSLYDSLRTKLPVNDWSYFLTRAKIISNSGTTESLFVIKRIRFKPGYATMWRNARSVLLQNLSLKFKYQYKLTRYLTKYKKFLNYRFNLFLEMQSINILLKGRLVPDQVTAELFITNGLFYLNGIICYNKYLQLFTNDFVQLIINVKYYIAYRWFLNWTYKRRIKLKQRARAKLTPTSSSEEKQKSRLMPHSVLFTKFAIMDIPKFIEIDFLTLSLFILYEPFLWTDLNIYSTIGTRFGVINLYNWKYIT